MIIRVFIVKNYKHSAIGLYIFYQMIQAPFHVCNIFFLQQQLYICHRIPSNKHADSTSFCTQVYPCSCCPIYARVYLQALVSQIYINSLPVCSYMQQSGLLYLFSFTLGKLCQHSVKSMTDYQCLNITYFYQTRSVLFSLH